MRRSWIWVIGLLGVAGAAHGQVMFEPIDDDITGTAASHDGNNPEEAYNFTAAEDSDGEPLDASKHNYVIHFETPLPVKALWSVTMYKLPAMLMVANPIKRYSIGDRTPGFTPNEDGSVTIYLQRECCTLPFFARFATNASLIEVSSLVQENLLRPNPPRASLPSGRPCSPPVTCARSR